MKLRSRWMAIAALFAGLSLQAQQKGTAKADLQYNVGIPTGSLKNNISENSPRGLQASVLFGISNTIAIGLGTGFQDFYQKYPRQLYKMNDGGDLSAVRSRSIQTIPVLFETKWNFSPGAAVQPYAALGVGGNLISYNDYAGEFTLEQTTKFGFAARPRAGVFVPFRKGAESGFNVGASYNIMPLKNGDLSSLNSIGVQAGVSIPLRK